jgi:hypothetical protein
LENSGLERQMKNNVKKYWWLILVISFTIGFPIIIACKTVDSNYFSYYGGVIGGILAIIGVFLTVQYSQKQYREDQRNSVIPYFAVNVLHIKFKSPDVKVIQQNGTDHCHLQLVNPAPVEPFGYYEYKLTKYTFIIVNGEIKIKNNLSKSQRGWAESGGIVKQQCNSGVYAYVFTDDVYLPVDFENVGNGSAINFRIGLNKRDMPLDKRQYAATISVSKGEHICVHIYAEDCGQDSKNLGEYDLTIAYQDIYGNKYSQTTEVNLVYSDEMKTVMVETDMYQKQERV